MNKRLKPIIIIWAVLLPLTALVSSIVSTSTTTKEQQLLELQRERNKVDLEQQKRHARAEALRESMKDPVKVGFLPKVQAEYVGNKYYESDINVLKQKAVNKLGINSCMAEYIAVQCKSDAKCFKYTLGVATAESGLFKKSMGWNNWFGFMYKWKKKTYNNIYKSVDDFIDSYLELRHTNKTPQERLTRSYYCTYEPWAKSGCPNWVKNVQRVLDTMNK